MTETALAFVRELDLPPVIVWDALVDADLVSGWLAEAVISPHVGGEYNLRWLNREGRPTTPGRITVLQTHERLWVDVTTARLRFELTPVPGGTRGWGTRLEVTVELEADAGQVPLVRADWLTNLDQLDELLRGHPVDWAHWHRDWHDSWSAYLGEVENSAS